jgi:hypothetical protein
MPVLISKTNRYLRFCLIIICLLLIHIGHSSADIYSWTDDSGSTHFTDRPETIPKNYRKQAEVKASEIEHSWEYLASENGADFFYNPSSVTYVGRNRFQVMTKESYARDNLEEYETQIIMDCARLMYKPVNSVRVDQKSRHPANTRDAGDDSGYMEGYKRFSHPYLILSKIICEKTR